MASQDLIMAAELLELARSRGVGSEVKIGDRENSGESS